MICWTYAFTTPFKSRELKAELGRWIDASCTDQKLVVGSGEQLSLIGFYAHADAVTLPSNSNSQSFLQTIDEANPKFVCVWHVFDSQEADNFRVGIQKRGFEVVSPPNRLQDRRELLVLARAPIQSR
jgi:hypothetical protein